MDSTPLGNSDPRCYFNHSIAETAELFCVSEQAVLRLIQQRSLRGQFRHGRWWVHLGPGQGQDRVVRLWHGTSRDRVFSIMAHGFELATGGKQSWLTTGELYARKAAIGSAQKRGSSPVIVLRRRRRALPGFLEAGRAVLRLPRAAGARRDSVRRPGRRTRGRAAVSHGAQALRVGPAAGC